MVAGEEYLVPARSAARYLHCHGAGLAAALAVADHLRAGDRVDQQLGQLDLLGTVDRVQAALVYLLLHRAVHGLVRVTVDDRAHAVDPVNVLVAVHVHEAGPLGALSVNGADALGELAGSPAHKLRPARYQLAGPVVQRHRVADSLIDYHSCLPGFCMRLSLACDRVCDKFDSDSRHNRLWRDDDTVSVVEPYIK